MRDAQKTGGKYVTITVVVILSKLNNIALDTWVENQCDRGVNWVTTPSIRRYNTEAITNSFECSPECEITIDSVTIL